MFACEHIRSALRRPREKDEAYFHHLSFGKAVLALLIWPYYFGVALTPLLAR
jgi:hypothetical protein